MISYEEARNKACTFYQDYVITQEWEDETNFGFCFGIEGREPLPGMEEILINKKTGFLSTFNPFLKIQQSAPKFTDEFFNK